MPTTISNQEHADEPVRYLRLPQVLARVGVSWVTLYRWEKKGIFPKRRLLGQRVIGWREADIDQWCASRPELGQQGGV